MKYAETGFNLEIDLSRGNIEKVASDPGLTELHLGGQGTEAKMMWDRVAPEVDPFSPQNLLIFSAGLLHGTSVPGANRTSISSISPQSNMYVNSGLGGYFGPEMKYAGYDKIVVRGKSPSLVYLWIKDDKVEIRDASHLQGKSAFEAAAIIQKEVKDSKARVAAIGLAGENKVAMATIEHSNSSASRGVGAIMGDKNLKAIAVRGSKTINNARAEELWKQCIDQFGKIYENPYAGDAFLRKEDDAWHTKNLTIGGCQVKPYWSDELQEEWTVHGEKEHRWFHWDQYMQHRIDHVDIIPLKNEKIRGTGCYNCPKECHDVISQLDGSMYFLKGYGKLAYAMAADENLKLNYALLKAMQDYGLDEFAMPQVFAFVSELQKAGILTDEDLPEYPSDSLGQLAYLVEKVAKREGIGDKLANGIYEAARQIGKGAETFDRNSVKKVEQAPLRQDTVNYAYFLMYATGDKANITQIEGSFPQMPIASVEDRKKFAEIWEAAPEKFKTWFLEWEPGQPLPIEAAVEICNWNEAMHYLDDAVGICNWLSSFRGQFGGRPPYHINNLPMFISLATGMELDADKLLEITARNRNLVRAINVRRGLRRADEKPPADIWQTRDPEMEAKVLDAYYEFKGWNKDGVPTEETLNKLGLGYVSEDFQKRGIWAE